MNLQNLSALPLGFEQNLGQAGTDARFVSHVPGYIVSFLRDGVSLAFTSKTGRQKSESVRLSLVGARNVEPQGAEVLPGLFHYYIGNDPAQWKTNVRQFRQVRYHDIYPGIDLVFYRNHRQLEFDFDVAPGADVSAIRLKVEGAVLKKIGATWN